MDLKGLTAVELGKKIQAKEVTVKEAVEACFAQIDKVEKEVNSFVSLQKEAALKRAEEVQKLIDDGTLTGPLAGVPVAIKDNMCTEGVTTTCSSKILSNFVPTFSAEAVLNLEKAGAVVIGKTNMDEFAMGSTTETSYYGETKNPWNLEHVPGGSSGGSCAAVAALEVPYALGSDTGGSIRQPSSYCGIVGIKPTYGTVSRYGLIAYGSSLDQIGPVARDVTDCATVLETIASHDVKDSTSVERQDTDFTSALVNDVKGMKIGIPKDYFGEGLDEEVKKPILEVAEVLKNAEEKAPEAKVNGVLIQPMLPKGVEVIVGVNIDPQFGPMILCGLGGVFVEVFKDVALYPAPLSKGEPLEMIRTLKGFKMLSGYRGGAKCDIDALAELMVQIADYAVANKDTLCEMDLNPVFVYEEGKGVDMADAVIIKRK